MLSYCSLTTATPQYILRELYRSNCSYCTTSTVARLDYDNNGLGCSSIWSFAAESFCCGYIVHFRSKEKLRNLSTRIALIIFGQAVHNRQISRTYNNNGGSYSRITDRQRWIMFVVHDVGVLRRPFRKGCW